jgi:hypothetical protein
VLSRTHERIALGIAREIKLSDQRQIDVFVNGSKAPDSWHDFPHHNGKEKEIRANIVTARIHFLQKDDSWTYHLGIALHYLQDMWTLRPRLAEKHTEWEQKIESSKILKNERFKKYLESVSLPEKVVKAYLKKWSDVTEEDDKERTPLEIVIEMITTGRPEQVIIEGKHAWSDPVIDLNFAYYISLKIARYVVQPINETKKAEYEQLVNQKNALDKQWEISMAEEERLNHYDKDEQIDDEIKRIKDLEIEIDAHNASIDGVKRQLEQTYQAKRILESKPNYFNIFLGITGIMGIIGMVLYFVNGIAGILILCWGFGMPLLLLIIFKAAMGDNSQLEIMDIAIRQGEITLKKLIDSKEERRVCLQNAKKQLDILNSDKNEIWSRMMIPQKIEDVEKKQSELGTKLCETNKLIREIEQNQIWDISDKLEYEKRHHVSMTEYSHLLDAKIKNINMDYKINIE